MQLHSGYDQPPSLQEQKFDIFSNNGANLFEAKHKESSKLLSPEMLRSRRSSHDNQAPDSNSKSFADKIFKNMGQSKADMFTKKKSPEAPFSQQMSVRKRTKNKMMDSIVEQNEGGPGKPKGARPESRGFYFTNKTISKLAKGGLKRGDSTAIKININDKKKHAFNPAFNVESKFASNTQPSCL